MSVKQLIAFGKLLVLLLFSNGAIAKTVMPFEQAPVSNAVTLYKAGDSIHKDGLQPQVPSVQLISEHQAKPFSFGYAVLFYDVKTHSALDHVGQTQVLLQDANRCESVSRLLFPYHFFW